MSTLPAVPPILDADRVIFLTVSSPTSVIPVTFPVFGAQEDLQVIVNFAVLDASLWTFTSASGSSLSVLPLPITDGQVTLLTPVSAGTIEIIGNWQPRQVIQPSAPGIARREFNQVNSTLIASLREVARALKITPNFVQTDALGNGFYNVFNKLLSNVADPQSNQDAVNLEYLNVALSALVSYGGIAQLQSWSFTGNGVTTAFSIPSASLLTGNSLAYVVSVNGLIVDPSLYTINTATQFITFTSAPANLGAGIVRLFGVSRAITNLASTPQALAGTDDNTFMSPLKTAQAVAADLIAFLASTPAFTSAAAGLTAANGDDSTKLATTAFVQAYSGALPSGRLTLSTGVPVMSAAVLAGTTVFYTPYMGAVIPLWDGTRFAARAFSEISQALGDATKSPAASVAASVYDLFVWNDAGTVRLSRGPVWTNTTTRSAGTAVARVSGILVNSVGITNGPGAGFGTYVGTIATDAGGATVTFNPVASGAGGPTNGCWVGLWNQYNRKYLTAVEQDTTNSWTYAVATTRASNGSNNNRITIVVGQVEDSVNVLFSDTILSNIPHIAIGVDSTSATSGNASSIAGSAASTTATANYAGLTQLGVHFYQALERANGSSTFFGQGPTIGQAFELVLQTNY